MELIREDYNWTDTPIVGLSLILMQGSIDSFGNKIKAERYYEIGKHKETGMVAILPTERNMKEDFVNDVLKKQNKFN